MVPTTTTSHATFRMLSRASGPSTLNRLTAAKREYAATSCITHPGSCRSPINAALIHPIDNDKANRIQKTRSRLKAAVSVVRPRLIWRTSVKNSQTTKQQLAGTNRTGGGSEAEMKALARDPMQEPSHST